MAHTIVQRLTNTNAYSATPGLSEVLKKVPSAMQFFNILIDSFLKETLDDTTLNSVFSIEVPTAKYVQFLK